MTLDGVIEAPEQWIFRFWNDELASGFWEAVPRHDSKRRTVPIRMNAPI
jgi:hypothetical protein